MPDLIRWLFQFLHVFAAILWVGGGFYTLVVQLPALLATAPEARGAAMAQIGPRQIRYITRVAEVTIATGFLSAFASGRLVDVAATAQTLWGWAIGVGAVLAIALYVLVQAVVKPLLFRMLALGNRAREGDASAGAQMPALVARFRRLGYLQLAAGAIIVLLMVTARLL